MGLQDRDWYWEAKKEKELEEERAKRILNLPTLPKIKKQKREVHWLLKLLAQLFVVLLVWAFLKRVVLPLLL